MSRPKPLPKSMVAAEAMVPICLLSQNRDQVVEWVARGYRAGHAAHTRWTNKNWMERTTEVEKVALELVSYLDGNRGLNSVGAESQLHKRLRAALNGSADAASRGERQ